MAPAPLRPGAGGPSSHSGDAASLKVFVGGLDQSVNDIDFRTHFEQFGRITDAVIMFDRITKRSRGFGFVTYEDVGAMQVCVHLIRTHVCMTSSVHVVRMRVQAVVVNSRAYTVLVQLRCQRLL
jgi:RNA recognition motif-containing protein